MKRLENNLAEGVDYKYKPDGSIDWRAMLNPKYLVVNRQHIPTLEKKFGCKLDLIPKDQIEDRYLLVLLQGWKDLASLRGYYSVIPDLVFSNDYKASCQVTIDWFGIPDTGGARISFGWVGSASRDSTMGFGSLYLETVANNRAFSLAVRNFLGVEIVGFDEIGTKVTEEPSSSDAPNIGTPQAALAKAVGEINLSFNDFRTRVSEKHLSKITGKPENWQSFTDVETTDAIKLLGIIKGSSS